MSKKVKRAALYCRVSTGSQSIESQVRELTAVAEQRGWVIVRTYDDVGISGSKGRDKRPGLDSMLKDASKGKFDVVMSWALDRIGRSLIDLLNTIKHLETCGVDLYLDQQDLDTTTAQGRLLFQINSAFAEFERAMITQRVNAGLKVVKDKLARDGQFETKRGIIRTKLGRPGAEPEKLALARQKLAEGIGIGKIARELGLGAGTVHRLAREMRGV